MKYFFNRITFRFLSIIPIFLLTSSIIADEKAFLVKRFEQKFHVTFTVTPKVKERAAFRQILALPVPRSDEKHTIENLKITLPPGIQQDVQTFPENGERYLPILTNGSLNRPVTIEYDATIPSIHYNLPSDSDIKPYKKDSDLYKLYTSKESGAEPDHPEIRKIADEIWKDSRNALDFAERVYHYQQKTLKWKNTGSYGNVTQIFANGGGDCGALSTIYISILRNKGIPARKNIGGIIREGDGWDWHVWPEFYLEGYGWVETDPSYFAPKPGYFAFVDGMRIHFHRSGQSTLKTDDFSFQTGGIQRYAIYRKSISTTADWQPDENSSEESKDYEVNVNIKTIKKNILDDGLNSSENIKIIIEKLYKLISEKRKKAGLETAVDTSLNSALSQLLMNETIQIKEKSMPAVSTDCRSGCDNTDIKERDSSSLQEILANYDIQFKKYSWQRFNRGYYMSDPASYIISDLSDDKLLDSSWTSIGIGYAFDPVSRQHRFAVLYGIRK
jgi:hypothetical protein